MYLCVRESELLILPVPMILQRVSGHVFVC